MEGKTSRSAPIKEDLSPTWNHTAIFYRRDPEKPVKVQVWNHNLVMDTFMGQAVFLAPESRPSGKIDTILTGFWLLSWISISKQTQFSKASLKK